MKTRSQTRVVWMSLPVEIRLMILSAIAHQKHPGWASLASVCQEWQQVLEEVNFYKLKLRVPCLNDFGSIVSPQRREIIHHICLDVQLPRYTPKCCSKRRSPSARISSIVSDGICKLLSILCTWGPANKLALEINVYSPSDNEHWFRNIYLSSDDVEHDRGTMSDALTTRTMCHDPQHGWMHGQQVEAPPQSAMTQLFRPIHLRFKKELPRVEAVTCFIIRRQLRRCISGRGLGILLTRFDRLEQIRLEPWLSCRAALRDLYHLDLSVPMRRFLPNTPINKLIIFEDSIDFYKPVPPSGPELNLFDFVDPSKTLGAVYASKSLDLQHLALSFMVSAGGLFRSCQSTWVWSHLQSLALTSQLLQDDWENRGKIETLLCRASILVQQMPKLHTLVLWNGGKSHACAFIYRIDREGGALVTWRGTWHLELSPLVLKSWELAATNAAPFKFQIRHEEIQEVIKCHGDAIYHLDLPCQVIDPASLWQIRREGYILTQ